MHIFLKSVEELLHKKGFKRPWLAQETGISLSTINTWFSSDRPPRVELAYKIAQALDISLETLLTGKEPVRKEFEDETLSRIVRYLETKDHRSLTRIEAVLSVLEYLDLEKLMKTRISDKITDSLVGEVLRAGLSK